MVGKAGVVVVVGDVAGEEGRRLGCRKQPVVLEHVQRQRPGLVSVQHHTGAADTVNWRVYTAGGKLDHAVAFQCFTAFIEHDHVAGARFRPVQTERQNQITVVVTGHGHGKVVVDAFFEFIEHRQPVSGGKVDLSLSNRIDGMT
jgi:hypothetical protein